jgi:hypothetical protein
MFLNSKSQVILYSFISIDKKDSEDIVVAVLGGDGSLSCFIDQLLKD